MLEHLRQQLRALLSDREAAQSEIDALLAAVEAEQRADFTDAEDARFAELRGRLDDIDARRRALEERIAELEELERREAEARARADAMGARPPVVARVTREEPTYRPDSEHRWLHDLVLARRMDRGAMERLQRYDAEVRALSRTDGSGGYFVPPQWLVDQFVPLARAGRVTADLCRREALPAGTDSINIPKVATGTSVAAQNDNAAVSNTDLTDTSVSASVVTLAGQQVVAMQLIDQSPVAFEQVVMGDLMAELAKQVDVYVLTATSVGILNLSGINAVTYTDTTPTVPEAYPKLQDAVRQVHENRFMPPTAIVMHPRRWAWFLAALDSSNRPLVTPVAQFNPVGVQGDVASQGQVGQIAGLPVYVDANVPTNLGTGSNEDRIIVARFPDILLFEGQVQARVLDQTDANTLGVRIQVFEYLAFTAARYPKAISVISGTGLVTPTF